MRLAPGTRLGPYEIVAPLGAGGMGEVYKALDPRLNRIVAIKISKDQFDERFEREARAIASFNHHHICQIYDVGPNYLVMEYIEGTILKGPLPVEKVVEYGIQICSALETAHKQGIIHRDLKPTNILVHDSGTKLLDFGLAKVSRERDTGDALPTRSVDLTNNVVGTLQYMSPEQLDGHPADARSDIFALGAVLYEMVTGKRAFEGVSQASVIAAILQREPPDLGRAVPAALDHVIRRCLAKDPAARWQSAQELKHALEAIARSETSSGTVTSSSGHVRGRNRRVKTGIAAAFIVLSAAVGTVWFEWGGKAESHSLAVLPFVDLSSDKNQEYFSDGLTEELLNELARVRGLRVTGRTSSFQFKGKTQDTRTIGQRLNVATLVEGSVRRQGTQARIAVQLINASDGFQLWSATYDRAMNDLFAVQEEIAHAVTAAMKLTLLGEKPPSPSLKTANAEAYTAYLQGRYFLARRSKENAQSAAGYFEQAIQLDRNYAPAWVGLAGARNLQAGLAYVHPDDGYRQARDAIARALALDPNLGEAYTVLGSIQMFHEWDWAGADASYKRALALDPGDARIIRGAGLLAVDLGRLDEAVKLFHKALERDPLSANAHHDFGMIMHYAGKQNEAAGALTKSLDLAPEIVNAHCMLARVYLAEARPQDALEEANKEKHPVFQLFGQALAYQALGRKKEADSSLAALIATYQKDAPYQIAQIYAFRGEKERSFEWLDRAYAERDSGLPEMKVDPLLNNLHSDARYETLLKKMHL